MYSTTLCSGSLASLTCDAHSQEPALARRRKAAGPGQTHPAAGEAQRGGDYILRLTVLPYGEEPSRKPTFWGTAKEPGQVLPSKAARLRVGPLACGITTRTGYGRSTLVYNSLLGGVARRAGVGSCSHHTSQEETFLQASTLAS